MEEKDLLALPFITRDMLAFKTNASFSIQIRSVAQNDGTITLRGMTKEGQFIYKHMTGASGVEQIENFRIPDLPIFFTIDDEDLVYSKGELYVIVSLILNGSKVAQLGAGYVYDKFGLAWPKSQRDTAGIMTGYMANTTSADPAAGAEISYTLPGINERRIQSIRFTLVTSAGVANRRVHVVFTQGGVKVLEVISPIDQVASTTKLYTVIAGEIGTVTNDDNDIIMQIPNNLCVPVNMVISTETTNLQAGDNFSTMVLWAETNRSEISA
jgi:hypothetical protein